LKAAGVREGSAVLVGVSGGPDSTCLLHVLSMLSAAMRLSLSCCIVDHGIRGEEERLGDAEHVRGLCLSRGIPFILRAIPVGECERISRNRGRSLEEVARDLRHALLAEAARECGCAWIALGHTLDDQAETVTMRFFQGSDPEGLKGIPARRGRMIRPLLSSTRSEILGYLEEEGVSFRSDSSNADDRYLRNRVRHRVLPAADAVFPGYRRSLAAMASRLGMWAEFVSLESQRTIPWMGDGERFFMAREAFFSAHPALRMHALYRVFQRLRTDASPRRLPARFLAPALGGNPPGPRGTLLAGNGITIRYDSERVYAGRSIVSGSKKGYLIIVEADGEYPIRDTLVVVRRSVLDGDGSSGREVCIPASEIGSPCVLRSRRPGDALVCEGGTVSLKKLYSQWRVPEDGRWAIPVIADRKGALLILGEALGLRNRRARRTGNPGGTLRIRFNVQRR